MNCIPLHAISRLRPGTDGKGIRTLIAVHGCPLRCKYCLNPLSWDEKRIPKLMTHGELFETLKIDDIYFRATNGGITFGGGEPALYAEYIRTFIEKYCDHWKVDMETSINVSKDNLKILIPVIDHFFVDIKSWNSNTYWDYTGISNEQVIENLKLLAEECPEKVTVRIPLIQGYNDVTEQTNTVQVMESMGFRTNAFEYTLDVNDF